MNGIKLIGVDLDGTVFDSKKRISRENVEVFAECKRRGIEIVPVTGRPVSGIYEEHIEAIGCRYTINTNGAAVVDHSSGSVIISHSLSVKKAREICGVLDNFDCFYSLFNGGFGYLTLKDYENELKKWEGTPLHRYIKRTRRTVRAHGELLDRIDHVDNIYVTAATTEIRENIRREVEKIDRIFYTCSAADDVEIGGMCSKGSTLLELAGKIGINPDEVMAIGDSGNDLNMLESAGLAVAMGNAGEEIKNAADFVTKSCEESGVAYAIKKLIL